MPQVSAINCIHVPADQVAEAERIRDIYVDYFSSKPGFVSSTFYRAQGDNHLNYINVVVWASQEALDAVVNEGFSNPEGRNADGMKVLGKGFPPPIEVNPGLYTVIRSNVPAAAEAD